MQFEGFAVNLQEIKQQQQHSMTNDPNKLWPRGILPYTIDGSIGEKACFSIDWLLILLKMYNETIDL